MILLAGRIAEEEIFGLSITTGASNDLFEAHKLATNMIDKYGMGTHIIYPSNSEKYKILKDNDIINLIEYAEQISREIIHKSKDLILYTSKLLIKNKIITFDELENIININYKKSFITKDSNNKIKSYNNFIQLEIKNFQIGLDE
jgi:ATP-dependent Zn protease